jgi:hypothetical protein
MAVRTSRRPPVGDFRPVPAVVRDVASRLARERRDGEARRALLQRIHAEFTEMPGMCLTIPQASRLFGLPAQACTRVMVSLTDLGLLHLTDDGRYRLRQGAA